MKQSNKFPRALTKEEVREKFLAQVHAYVEYWEKNTPEANVHDKLSGLAFSILAMLDGNNAAMPGWKVVACPHSDDKAYDIEHGNNWYPQEEDDVDIAGSLHERWYKKDETILDSISNI